MVKGSCPRIYVMTDLFYPPENYKQMWKLNCIWKTCTWVSDSLSCFASCVLSFPTRYWFLWNSFSSWNSCSEEKVVLARLGRSRSRALGKTSSFIPPWASVYNKKLNFIVVFIKDTSIQTCTNQKNPTLYIKVWR